MTPPPAPTSLAAFTPSLLSTRYPHLPAWAYDAVHAIQTCTTKQQHDLPVAARTLLNITILPMPGFLGTREDLLDADVAIRLLFAEQKWYEEWKGDVDVWRLGWDLGRVWGE
ncbi:hypothetical protein CC86DRAFT_464033 [Ophiobolus disseminans]|uniref:Uncharacterized protein n=1 Tax=Ophiobolus disseminans TaxID=1469910 RepID=A0A6A7ACE2_9PLEO|nr:hypothetical protein CC86DRAFT_464033 [Ophiobolus disseminans]